MYSDDEEDENAGQTEMNDALRELRDSGAWSDLTLVCGPHEFKLHRSVLCARSEYFASACEVDAQKNERSVVKLEASSGDDGDRDSGAKGDDPDAVKLMVDFLYYHDYTPPDAHLPPPPARSPPRAVIGSDDRPKQTARKSAPSLPASFYRATERQRNAGADCQAAIQHIKMYTLGSKYDIRSLMSVALDKLYDAVIDCWDEPEFVRVIRLVYSTAVKDKDAEDLQNVIVQAVQEHKQALMRKKEVANAIASTAKLSFALWTNASPRAGAGVVAGRKRCFSCHERMEADDELEGCQYCGAGGQL